MRTQFPALRGSWLSIRSLFLLTCLCCFCIFSACLLPACGISLSSHTTTVTPVAGTHTSTTNTLITSGKLTVGSFTQYPPQEFVDPFTGQTVGFDVDLANALADRLHLHPRFVSSDFSSLIDNLLNRHYDVVISAIAMTPELQKKVDFIPYFRGGEALMVPAGNPDHIERLSDLCSHAVAVITDTFELQELRQVNMTCLKRHLAGLQLQAVPTQSEALALLRAHRVSALYADSAITDYAIHRYPQTFTQGGKVMNATVEGIIVRKEDTQTLQSLRAALQELQSQGQYHALIVKWGLYNGDISSTSPSSVQH